MTQGELKGAALSGGVTGVAQPMRQPASVYTPDLAAGPDRLGRAAHAQFLAEVVAHREAGTPLTIGIFGPAGAGKSSFLAALLDEVEAIDRGATAAGIATPFHGGMVVARLTAQPGLPASRALVAAVAAALADTHPRLLDTAIHAGLDTRAVAQDAADALATAREKLDAERQALDVLAGRQARLADTVLFETDGSGLDSFLRGNRGRIERRMRRFGASDDPVAAFKFHVRDAHETTALLARGVGWLRAFTTLRGQGQFLVLAVALLLAAWGLHMLGDNRDRVVGAVQAGGDKFTGFADWLAAQWHWLVPVRRLLEFGALAALAVNLLRGIGFLLPVQRGVNLLRHEIDARRRDLDSRIAQQTRRVEALGRDVERLSGRAAEAERRKAPAHAAVVPSLLGRDGEDRDGRLAAQNFFAVLGAAAQGREGSRATDPGPARVVVGLDGLDRLPSAAAAEFVETAAALLARPGLVLAFAADRSHLAAGLAETDPVLAAEKLGRLVQVPFDLGAGEDWSGASAYARALLGDSETELTALPPLDAARSALDRPWTATEGAVLEAVAPLAGRTPRAVKQFVNLYRIARADPLVRDAGAKDLAALALGLALQVRGLPATAASDPAQGGEIDGVFAARRVIATAIGAPFNALDGQRGYDVARSYGTGR